MDLLSSLLKVAGADEYTDNFKTHGIDPFTLKLLDDEDLTALGISDETKRKNLLENISKLQIPAESRQNTKIDETFAKLVLFQMSNQLNKHLANLSCAVMRNDIVVCDVLLGPSLKCLNDSVDSLENETKRLKLMLSGSKKTRRNELVTYGFVCGMLVGSAFILLKFLR